MRTKKTTNKDILVLNAGSSSLKFECFRKEKSLMSGMVDRIGKKAELTYCIGKETHHKSLPIKNHEKAVAVVLTIIKKSDLLNLSSLRIGHRVVHGGETFKEAVKITPSVLKKIEELSSLAPLHNPVNIAGIRACKKLLPRAEQVAVFDTAFHATIPKEHYLYALPYHLYKKDKIRRYGFHGTSVAYVHNVAKKVLKQKKKIIVCHIGNGASITALLNGKSFATSMGFTPLEGLMMGTRSGNIDPEIILHLMRSKKYSIDKVEHLIQKESGLLGISKKTSDMRDIIHMREDLSKVAYKMYVESITHYIGAYTALLGGLDAIIFTGGVGQNAWYVRRDVCEHFTFMSLYLDSKKNKANQTMIQKKNSKVKVLVLPTHEELQIAKEVKRVLS